MSYALAYLGTLAFVAFALWLRNQADKGALDVRLTLLYDRTRLLFGRVEELERVKTPSVDIGAKLAALESTVSTLALGAGLKQREPVPPKS